MKKKDEYCCVATSSRAWVQQVAVSYVQRGYHRFVEVWIPRRKDYAVADRKIIAKYNIDLTDGKKRWRKRNGYARYQYIRRGRFGVILIADPEVPEDVDPAVQKRKNALWVVMTREHYAKVLAEYGENLYCSACSPCKEDPGNKVTIDFEKEEGGHIVTNEGTQEEQKIPRIKHVYQYPICHEGYQILYRNGHASVRIDGRSHETLRRHLLETAGQRDLKTIKEIFNGLRLQPFAPVKSQLWKLVDELNVYRTKKRIRGKKIPYSVVGKCLQRQTGPLVVPTGEYPSPVIINNQKPWNEKQRQAA